MSQEPQFHPLAKPIRRLTLAVWVTAAALIFSTVAPYVVMLFPQFYAAQVERIEESLDSTLVKEQEEVAQLPRTSVESNASSTIPGEEFYALPLDKKIEQASAIAITRIEKTDDGRLREIVQEYLKKAPGITIRHEVGSELRSRYINEDDKTVYGDGAIVFFQGSPAREFYWSYFHGDRVRGLDDIPLALLREKCKQAQGAPNSAVQ
jgi:hypothetical protein